MLRNDLVNNVEVLKLQCEIAQNTLKEELQNFSMNVLKDNGVNDVDVTVSCKNKIFPTIHFNTNRLYPFKLVLFYDDVKHCVSFRESLYWFDQSDIYEVAACSHALYVVTSNASKFNDFMKSHTMLMCIEDILQYEKALDDLAVFDKNALNDKINDTVKAFDSDSEVLYRDTWYAISKVTLKRVIFNTPVFGKRHWNKLDLAIRMANCNSSLRKWNKTHYDNVITF